MSTNFSSWPFLSLGQEEWLRRFDGDEVVPVSFQFYDRKSTTPKKVIASATKLFAGKKRHNEAAPKQKQQGREC